MAWFFTASSSQYIAMNCGQFASAAMDYGTIACIVRRSIIPSAAFSGIVEMTGAGNAADLEFDTSSNIYFSLDGGTTSARETTTAYNTTGKWWCIIVSKDTGSNLPRYHVYDYSAGTWTHKNGDTALADGSQATNSLVSVGSYSTTAGDFYDGDIEAVGMFAHWVPGDTEAEAIGMHVNRLAWYDASFRAQNTSSGHAWFVMLDSGSNSDTLYDSVANATVSSTSASVPTISPNSVPLFGWGDSVTTGAGPYLSAVAATSAPPFNRSGLRMAILAR